MAYEEIIDTRDGYSVKIVADDDAQEPYNDGGSPLLRFPSRFSGSPSQVTGITSYEVPTSILDAAAQFEREDFERFLRIFHGATKVVWWFSREDTFCTFDNTAWRELVGAPEGSADLDEWKWYVEGEVYGVVLERAESRKADRDELDAAAETLKATNPYVPYYVVVNEADRKAAEDDDEWVEVDATWGYYGATYATETARERLAEAIADAAPTKPHAVTEDGASATCVQCGRTWAAFATEGPSDSTCPA